MDLEVGSDFSLQDLVDAMDESREIAQKEGSKFHNAFKSEKEGEEHELEFLTGVIKLEKGVEDVFGREYPFDWVNFQSLVKLDGNEKSYDFGGTARNPNPTTGKVEPCAFLRNWIDAWRDNGLSIGDVMGRDASKIIGSVWRTQRKDTWNWDIVLVSKPEGKKAEKKPSKSKDVKALVKQHYDELIKSGNVKEGQQPEIYGTAIRMMHPGDFKDMSAEDVTKVLEDILK